jgi:hypothetical protein
LLLAYPSLSLDLATIHFSLFRASTEHLSGHRCAFDEDVKPAAITSFTQQRHKFCESGRTNTPIPVTRISTLKGTVLKNRLPVISLFCNSWVFCIEILLWFIGTVNLHPDPISCLQSDIPSLGYKITQSFRMGIHQQLTKCRHT